MCVEHLSRPLAPSDRQLFELRRRRSVDPFCTTFRNRHPPITPILYLLIPAFLRNVISIFIFKSYIVFNTRSISRVLEKLTQEQSSSASFGI